MSLSNGGRILLTHCLKYTKNLPSSLSSVIHPLHPHSRLLGSGSSLGFHSSASSWLAFPRYSACIPRVGRPSRDKLFVRHLSWWRWNGSSSTIEPQDDTSIDKNVEPPYSGPTDTLEIVESREFLSEDNSALQAMEIVPAEAGVVEVVEGAGTGRFWSVLQVPVDAVAAILDGFHNVTGVPWWITIVGSTFVLRAALFPLTVTQLQKASMLARLGSQLPSPIPPPGSGVTLASQYQIFTKRRLELGAPSPAWLVAVPLIQVPLFILWIVSVRQMAMSGHPGFDCGGVLWFTDLTVPVQGALGALFPLTVAVTYFTNLQLSFKGMEQQKGVMGTVMKFYKWWLEAATIPAFIFGFYLPQGVFMYWITNNCCSLAQTVALRQPQIREVLGLPSLGELAKLRTPSAPPPPSPPQGPQEESYELKLDAVQNMSPDDLLVLAANCVSIQKEDEALQVLHFTVDKFPNMPEAFLALGRIYSKRQAWSKASEYHGHALRKTDKKELVIAASLGAGVAMYNLGQRTEAIKIMSVMTTFDPPPDSLSQHRYFKALVTLGSVMSQEGLKVEALELLRKAAKYEPMVEKVMIPQLEEEIRRRG